MNDAERYRQDKLESGQDYQDFIVEMLFRRRALVIMQFAGREYQIRKGESLSGVEIKHDEKYATTGNLWIEVGEKAMPRDGDYAKSGILRDDNTWLYVIGDYQTVFVFAKRTLVLLHESGTFPLKENERKTSMGFLLPESKARKWAALVETIDLAPSRPVLVKPSIVSTTAAPLHGDEIFGKKN